MLQCGADSLLLHRVFLGGVGAGARGHGPGEASAQAALAQPAAAEQPGPGLPESGAPALARTLPARSGSQEESSTSLQAPEGVGCQIHCKITSLHLELCKIEPRSSSSALYLLTRHELLSQGVCCLRGG